jgi:hypothetical protein
MAEAKKENITCEIVQHIGVISEGKGGWKKELNLVSWGGREAKLDIRDWAADRQKMSKGITLTREEAAALAGLLAGI